MFVYSPFVEMELARISKDKNEKDKALELLLNGLSNSRKIAPNDEVKNVYRYINFI